jgi:putative transposase
VITRLAVMMSIRISLSPRNVEDFPHERGNDISHETVLFWQNGIGPMSTVGTREKKRTFNFFIKPSSLNEISGYS